jgi:hypothetical protein
MAKKEVLDFKLAPRPEQVGDKHPKQLAGGGKVVEADETYYGKVEKPRHPAKPYRKGRRGPMDKRPILALVERGGSVRTFPVPVADKANVR